MEAAWSYLLHLEDEGEKPLDVVEEPLDFESSETLDADEQLLHLNDGAKLIICMVGKPARGKSFMAAKIQRYSEWLGYRARHIETVSVRRKLFGKVEPDDFFNPNGAEMATQRGAAQEEALKESLDFLQKGGQVVIYDASNSTRERRRWVTKYVEENLVDKTDNSHNIVKYRLLWVESICENRDLIVQNFLELRKTSATTNFMEYRDLDNEQATAKFLEKLRFYDEEYEALDMENEADRQLSFIKIVEFSENLMINRVRGYMESKLVSFCMNIHTEPRAIILVRHGQSEYNLQDRIGGDPNLTEAGDQFARNLAKFVEERAPHGLQIEDDEMVSGSDAYSFNPGKDLFVWTSTLKRTVGTTKYCKCRANVQWTALGEIDAGVCECMTYTEFKTKLTSQYMKRQQNKASWRYPGGESYIDVKKRLEPLIFELERQRKPILICSHRAVLRCLYSYFFGISIKECPFLPFPLHTALVLTPTSSGWNEERIPLAPNIGDTGAHEQDVQAAAAKILKSQAKRRKLREETKK